MHTMYIYIFYYSTLKYVQNMYLYMKLALFVNAQHIIQRIHLNKQCFRSFKLKKRYTTIWNLPESSNQLSISVDIPVLQVVHETSNICWFVLVHLCMLTSLTHTLKSPFGTKTLSLPSVFEADSGNIWERVRLVRLCFLLFQVIVQILSFVVIIISVVT